MITSIFFDLLHKSMSVFIDDFSTQATKALHVVMYCEYFIQCRQCASTLNPSKLYMAILKNVLLGYVESESSKPSDPDKIEVILNLQPPITIKVIHRVLSHFKWHRNIIEDNATSTMPLTNFIRKHTEYEWTPKCEANFDALKCEVDFRSIPYTLSLGCAIPCLLQCLRRRRRRKFMPTLWAPQGPSHCLCKLSIDTSREELFHYETRM